MLWYEVVCNRAIKKRIRLHCNIEVRMWGKETLRLTRHGFHHEGMKINPFLLHCKRKGPAGKPGTEPSTYSSIDYIFPTFASTGFTICPLWHSRVGGKEKLNAWKTMGRLVNVAGVKKTNKTELMKEQTKLSKESGER